ncbi:MAG TPA: flagellar biosynthetic protein FliO [Acidobacteriaceae bacterium]|jgi:flagellar biogenesis protein FliO|nr:flagellar biosynthetic protein FliO [Acidobacteriaceae bacterium]
MSATKRLRVAEVASLGDKRFVALVSVEGREFLIGGGASGVSLLTPLRGEVDVLPAHSQQLQGAGECE